jgi:hypothetical protein
MWRNGRANNGGHGVQFLAASKIIEYSRFTLSLLHVFRLAWSSRLLTPKFQAQHRGEKQGERIARKQCRVPRGFKNEYVLDKD